MSHGTRLLAYGVITVEGTGFDAESVKGMRERCELMDGKLKVRSEVGEPAVVRFEMGD